MINLKVSELNIKIDYDYSSFIRRITRFFFLHEKLTIFTILFIIYNINCGSTPSGDTIPASLLPFSIIENNNLYFDQFIVFFQNTWGTPYFFIEQNGHNLSFFPIVTPILVTPLYIIPYIILKLISYPIDMFNPGFVLLVLMMEKLSAATIVSFSGVFVFLSLKELINRKIAWIGTFIFAFATNTWAIGSQALWQHGMVELLLSMMIYLVIINEKKESTKNIIYLGILSGLFIFNRPPDSVLLLPIFYYIYSNKLKIPSYFSFMFIVSAPFLLYNFYFFDNLLGGYNHNLEILTFSSNTLINFIGLLFSPNRGLFIYTPLLILSLFGYLNIVKIRSKRLRNFLFLFGFSILLNILVYSTFDTHWWAGFSYGPRFLTGMLPILIIFLCLYLDNYTNLVNRNMNHKKVLSLGLILILLLFSIFVQIVGVFYYPNGSWDADPNIDLHPERLWYWNDSQIIRTFQAGPRVPSPLANINLIWTSKNIKDIINDGIQMGTAWHGFESWNDVPTRWMKNNGTIKIYSSTEKNATIDFNIQPFYKQRTLQVYVNDELAHQSTISSQQQLSFKIHLEEGDNIIKFYTPYGCQRPADIPELKNADARCLSFAFQNITLT